LLENLTRNLNHGERDLRLMELAKVYLNKTGTISEPYRLTAVLTGLETTGHWSVKPVASGFWNVKGIIEDLFDNMGIVPDELSPSTEPYLITDESLCWKAGGQYLAAIGVLEPAKADAFGIDVNTLKQDIWLLDIDIEAITAITRRPVMHFEELPRFPAVVRDLSILAPSGVDWTSIRNAIMEVDKKLIGSVSLFDEYRGKQVPDGFRSISLRIFARDREKTLTDERVEQLLASIVNMLENRWQIKMR